MKRLKRIENSDSGRRKINKVVKGVYVLIIFTIIVLLIISYKIYRVKFAHSRLPIFITKHDTIKQGQTLLDIFSEYDIPTSETFEIARSFASIYNTKYMKESTEYDIILTTSGQFYKFSYIPVPNEEYNVRVSTFGISKYIAEVYKYQLEKSIILTSGTVTGSLYQSMIASGLAPDIIMHFAEIFESKIDFFTETMPDDIFRLKVELYKLNGKIVKHGEILSAEYEGKNAKEFAVLFEYSPNSRDYFNLSGASLKRAFLKVPLSYRRISSYFSFNRFHPILKIVRPHLGIDYSAPTGTPVSTIGDGVVTFAGWCGDFGNLVKIKHPNGYKSWYGHLSKISKNSKVGKKVFIGNVIGYVGSTGLSTGPHLDFRIKKGKKFVNFLKLKLPSKKYIPANRLIYFKEYAQSELDMLKNMK